jgi:stage II sporulation protein R
VKNRIEEREPFPQRFHRICLAAAILIAALLTGWVTIQRGILVENRTQAATSQLAEQVLRFHVLADSDSTEDQRIKMQVKEAVISYLQEGVSGEKSLEGTKTFVTEHLEEIRELALQTVKEQGSSDTVSAELVTDEFPEKTYGDVTFPAGTYQALRISIGSGQGHNWWCCLYPNLCFRDAVHATVDPEDKQALQQLLDEDAYEMITCTTDFKIKWFFFGDQETKKK